METPGGGKEGEDGKPAEVANVVRIPRDWFGPRDELVPFGPAAVDRDDAPSLGHREPQSPRGAEPAAPLDPNSFWDEGSGAIQDVVEAAPLVSTEPDTEAEPHDGVVPGLVLLATRSLARLSGPIGVRTVAATIAVVLLVGVAVAGWVLGGAHTRVLRTAAASVTTHPEPLAGDHAAREFERPVAQHPIRVRTPKRASHHSSRAAPTARSTIQVVYHPSYSPAPTAGRGTLPSATMPSGSGATSGASSGSTASETTSKPAFGPYGALGPMGSPDG